MADPERQDNSPERSLYSVSRSGRADVLLTIYFIGMVASGVEGLVRPGELGTLLSVVQNGMVGTVFSWSMIVVGVAGVLARLFDSRMGEFYAILGLSALTLFNGAALLPEHPQTAIRLMVAPCMMVPYAWMRLGFTVPREQVYSIKRAIEDEQRNGNGGHDR